MVKPKAKDITSPAHKNAVATASQQPDQVGS